ncbi:MAG: ABC transporter permease [Prevotellaceae bacterium]|jgi:putative ABC transport system permease protein|nr:ABC transporter permease [Prevotellaceae bacterium]
MIKKNNVQTLYSYIASPLGWLKGLFLFDLDWWQEIWITITHNKSRSVLTAFGVFWGMFMLASMVGAGSALENGMMSQIEGFATNSCFVSSGRTSTAYKGFRKGRGWSIVNEDIPVLIKKIPEMQYIAPVLFGGQSDKNVMRGERYGSYSIKGNYPSYNLIDRNKIIYGRYINDIDISEKRKVCVIGKRVYEELFDRGTNPAGHNIRINGIYFQVIGVAQGNSNINIGGSTEETVVLPFTTLQQAFNQGNRVHFLAITAQQGVKVSVVEEKVKAELKQLHNISPTDQTGVWSMNVEDQFTMFLYLSLGVSFLIFFVGLGTLFTGGIGVSNIMLVTVRERTKEIGIRRALGATPRNIITQIMSESIILTMIAGIAGLITGVWLLRVAGIALSSGDQFFKDPQINFTIAAGALFVLIIVGIIAGYLPAKRAMNIKPIEAIREE